MLFLGYMSSNLLGLPAENSSLSMTAEWGRCGFIEALLKIVTMGEVNPGVVERKQTFIKNA